ncbi:MAG: iron-containing alcohol dehydrogenase [Lentisphaerae bacterium]|nr:iron-containing alcohol dehydrogenase [Lentisphaerota bacterium]
MRVLPENLYLPARTLSGPGTAERLLSECAAFGTRGLLVHGRSLETGGAVGRITAQCPAGLEVRTWRHPGGEPTLEPLRRLLDVARRWRPAWIAAVGGGSVMDIGKAAAGLLDAPDDPAAYHDGAPLPPGRTPYVAAPSTAGTGSEATFVSVLTNPATGVKKSIRHASHLARLVILDPQLLAGCPPGIMAASGLDAVTQAIEAYLSRYACWFSDSAALQGLELLAGNLEAVHGGAGDVQREAVLTGSYLAGLALSHARLGVVHGLAHPLGSRYGVPHGLACGICLPYALDFNREAAGPKYARLGAVLGGDPAAESRALLERLGLTSPFSGRPLTDRDGIIEETLASGSTRANPRPVGREDVAALLERIFE